MQLTAADAAGEDPDVHRGRPGSLPPRLESSCWAVMIWRLGIPNGPPPWFACLRAGPGFTAGAGVAGRARLVGVAIMPGCEPSPGGRGFAGALGHHTIASLDSVMRRVEERSRASGQSLDQAAAVVVEDLERAAAALTARTAPQVPRSGVLVAAAGVLLKAEPAVSSGHGARLRRAAPQRGVLTMTTLMLFHEADDVGYWLASPRPEEFFGPMGMTARTFIDPEKTNRVGLIVEVPTWTPSNGL